MTLAVPGRRTLIVVYDLLHLFALHGPRLRRSEVIAYLARAGMGRRATGLESRLRGFERLKVFLRQLEIRYESERVPGCTKAEALLVIPNARQELARLARLLDTPRARPAPALEPASSG